MNPPLPSLTRTWHNASYPAISPHRPESAATGKTIIITGAGSGIGRATAQSFAKAGAQKIVLIGRTEASLRETAKTLTCNTSVQVADVTDEEALCAIAAATGQWDVMVLAAGYISPRLRLGTRRWPSGGKTSSMVMSQVFLPTANPDHATIVALTAAVVFPAARLQKMSGYITSKLAVVKLVEFLAAENPNLVAVALHPGMIDTKVFRESGADPHHLPMDTVELPGDFTVWLTSPEAAFLSGRCAWANWDVDELKAKADEIKSGLLLTSGIYGWPFHSP
ncbi:hypothetical protein N7539_001039 [Penicillium diatomitis]|uniref:NADP(+)-dependent dehydrogenase n=1 Tax=Penicillium diatomitis TaxID=2819901 RepID=A0A9X0C2R2_9EURO|nr:uncharacterized protein N7539_001039 [Penicillium diatomitis]KAJ5495923.1 hypothetical protein N7539_001039 [Penicillium diatomitis]